MIKNTMQEGRLFAGIDRSKYRPNSLLSQEISRSLISQSRSPTPCANDLPSPPASNHIRSSAGDDHDTGAARKSSIQSGDLVSQQAQAATDPYPHVLSQPIHNSRNRSAGGANAG